MSPRASRAKPRQVPHRGVTGADSSLPPPKKGGRNLYRRGYALEQRIRKKLETTGWSVTRSAGSHNVDLVAALAGVFVRRLVYIACKRDGSIPPHERLDLVNTAKKAGAEAYVVAPDGRAKYRVREVSDWHMSEWQDLAEVF